MPEESVLMVARTLLHLFPHINFIDYIDQSWEKVVEAICSSREPVVDCLGNGIPPLHLKVTLVISPQKSHSRILVDQESVWRGSALTSPQQFHVSPGRLTLSTSLNKTESCASYAVPCVQNTVKTVSTEIQWPKFSHSCKPLCT